MSHLRRLSSLLALVALDDRPRNANGQFNPASTGGIDPMVMKRAYGQAREQARAERAKKNRAVAAGLIGIAGAGYVGNRIGSKAGLLEGITSARTSKQLAKAKRASMAKPGFGSVVNDSIERMKNKAKRYPGD